MRTFFKGYELYIARKNICPCSHLKNKTKQNKTKKYLSCKNCKRFQTRSGEFHARRSREKGARACRSQGTEKSGKSSTFVWTGAALSSPEAALLLEWSRKKKNKMKKKKKKRQIEITMRRSWGLGAFIRLNYDDRFKTFAMKITFPLSSISKQRFFFWILLCYLFICTKRKQGSLFWSAISELLPNGLAV